MTNKLQQNYPQFFELNGTALNDGYIYIGVDGLDPTTNALPVYLDASLTTPISQPLRTTGGYVYYNGNPVSIYFGASNYSITVKNSLSSLIYTNLSAYTMPFINTAMVVENIAELKTFSNAEANQIEVLGYYTKGDGGGGLFYWDGTSTEADNGGTIIQATGITTGRWKRVFSGAINVVWFGAKGDGITDDTIAIQKALDTSMPVVFEPRTYKTTSTLYVYADMLFNMAIINSSANYCFDLKQLKNIKISNGQISSSATSGAIFYVGGLWFGEFDNLNISGNGGTTTQIGILFDAKHKDSAYSYWGCFSINVTNCFIGNVYTSIKSNWVDASRRNTHINIIGGWLQGIYSSITSIGDANMATYNTAFDNSSSQYHIIIDNTINSSFFVGEFPTPIISHILANGSNEYTNIIVNGRDCGITGTPTIYPNVNTAGVLTKNASNVNGYKYQMYTSYELNNPFNLDVTRTGSPFNLIKWKGSQSDGTFIHNSVFQIKNSGTHTFSNGTLELVNASNPSYKCAIQTNNNYVLPFNIQATRNGSYSGNIIAFTGSEVITSYNFMSDGDNTKTLGSAGNRWSVIYAGTGTINTSDDREKTYFKITDTEKKVALELKENMKKFRFNSSIKEKGEDKARIHFGASAQTVKSIFEKYGLNAFDYAILCYDEWDDKYEIKVIKESIFNDEGELLEKEITEKVLVIKAGNRYGLRYDELLSFIIGCI